MTRPTLPGTRPPGLRHPVWLVGFRPLFIAAIATGAILPVVWVAVILGAMVPAASWAIPPQQWHAHEMFFGFGAAVLGGFLLTASKNWLGIRGLHGTPLMLLCLAWVADRIALGWGAGWPLPAVWILSGLYLTGLVAVLLHDLIRHRATDSYPDNFYFILALPFLIPAKYLMLTADGTAGTAMALAVFRLSLLIIFERTLTQFMLGAFQCKVLRHPWLDHGIKSLALVLIAAPGLPVLGVAGIEVCLALLLLARLLFWHPRQAFGRLDIGIMYLAYLLLCAQLLVDAAHRILPLQSVGSVSIHLFTVGALGLVVPAMILRIARGHTGRKVAFTVGDKAALWLMIGAAACRVVAPQFWPTAYPFWLGLSALGWLLGFAHLAWHLIPLLIAPRMDGREH
jgi:uncharacterized protein involved in response to NO